MDSYIIAKYIRKSRFYYSIGETKVRNKGLSLVVIFIMTAIHIHSVSAYVLNGWKMTSPKNINVYIAQAYEGNYKDKIITYTKKWSAYKESPFSFKGFSRYTQSCNDKKNRIIFAKNSAVSNGTYAISYNEGKTKTRIILYKDFFNTSTANKNETIVHEVGHCVGLGHCQSSKNSSSVMREQGFNGKAYPLSDDKNGIKKLY